MAAPSTQLTIRGNANDAIVESVRATHSHDGRNFDVKFLLLAAKDVLLVPDKASSEEDEKNVEANAIFEYLISNIEVVSDKINSIYKGGADLDAMTISILDLLSKYSWDVKLVIALAAFAMNYGEFFLFRRSYDPKKNPQDKSVAFLKGMTHILEPPKEGSKDIIKEALDKIEKLIGVMLEIANCIINFKEFPKYMNETAIHVYSTIRSILACASQINGLIETRHGHIASTVSWEISSWIDRLESQHNELERTLKTYQKEKYEKTFKDLSDLFDEAPDTRSDNINVLKALICAKRDLQHLTKGSENKKTQIRIDDLRGKKVLLLISDLDNFVDESIMLDDIYSFLKNDQKSEYEIVWLPITDPEVNTNEKFQEARKDMNWCSVDPYLIDPGVIKFVKQKWHFGKKPMLVVLGPQGQVDCLNAFPMMWIWGTSASPFTTSKEKELWSKEGWRLELLVVQTIDPIVYKWIKDEKNYICLYGGEDKEWIEDFIIAARVVANATGICLEMVYVGKRNQLQRRFETIQDIVKKYERSHSLQDLTAVWQFWVRIESMRLSRNQLKATTEKDEIMKGILTILTFDSTEDGWAIFGKGSDHMVQAKGNTILKCFQNYEDWKYKKSQENDFMSKLSNQIGMINGKETEHCNSLILPSANGIPEAITCEVCKHAMNKYSLFRCCK